MSKHSMNIKYTRNYSNFDKKIIWKISIYIIKSCILNIYELQINMSNKLSFSFRVYIRADPKL